MAINRSKQKGGVKREKIKAKEICEEKTEEKYPKIMLHLLASKKFKKEETLDDVFERSFLNIK